MSAGARVINARGDGGTNRKFFAFDAVFHKLRRVLRTRVEAQIDEIGSRLASFPHHRLKGSNRFRARVGDYRIITPSTWSRIKFICWRSAIGEKYIAVSKAYFFGRGR